MEATPPGSLSQPNEPVSPEEEPRHRRSKWWAVVGLGLAALLLGGCQLPTFGARTPITSQGQDAIKLWQGFFIAGAAMFVVVFSLITWAVIRYRRRSDEIPRQTQYHTLLEILYTAVPIVFVLILFSFTFVTENNVDALPKQNVTVTVTGFQWGWRFHYTTKNVTVIGAVPEQPQMVLPEHEAVRIRLESHDVIHGFYVPAFDFSRYAQPGIVNKFTLYPKALGVYRGQCSQFCGLYHSLMRFSVRVVTPSAFTTWVHSHRTSGNGAAISTAQKNELGSSHATSLSTTPTGSTGL